MIFHNIGQVIFGSTVEREDVVKPTPWFVQFQVGWVEYNASSRDCAGLDAWKCLARQAEEVVARESGYVEDGGSPGTAGPTKGNKKGALARTFLGCVLERGTSLAIKYASYVFSERGISKNTSRRRCVCILVQSEC